MGVEPVVSMLSVVSRFLVDDLGGDISRVEPTFAATLCGDDASDSGVADAGRVDAATTGAARERGPDFLLSL